MNAADRKRLEEIVQRIHKIEQYASAIAEDEFYRNELLRDACHANLIIIAEAASRMSSDVKEKYNGIKWKEIAGFRNLIIHEYFRINWRTVWQVITQDLSELNHNVKTILNNEEIT